MDKTHQDLSRTFLIHSALSAFRFSNVSAIIAFVLYLEADAASNTSQFLYSFKTSFCFQLPYSPNQSHIELSISD